MCLVLFPQKLDSPVNMQLSLVQWGQVGNRIHANYITAANALTFPTGSGKVKHRKKNLFMVLLLPQCVKYQQALIHWMEAP